jgi:CRP/FNR family transcriptional regulator, nitrogen oxide reductase regulator
MSFGGGPSQHGLFAGFAAEERESILLAGAVLTARKGEVLFREGEPAATLFLLEAGRVKLTQLAASGVQVILRYMAPGEIFAAVALLGARYPVTATATERSRLRSWSGEALQALAREHPRFTANVLQAVSAHAREALSRIRELATEAVPQRLARTLLRLSQQIGRRAADGTVALERITQQELAEIAGTSLYTVSRTLAGWSSALIVETGRQTVRILDSSRLAKLGE